MRERKRERDRERDRERRSGLLTHVYSSVVVRVHTNLVLLQVESKLTAVTRLELLDTRRKKKRWL